MTSPRDQNDVMKTTPLRLPQSLWDAVSQAAEEDRRSVNKEMVALLEEALQNRAQKADSREATRAAG